MENLVGAWIKEMRKSKPTTQKGMADALGITVRQLRRIENGYSGTTDKVRLKLLKDFVPEWEFFGGNAPKHIFIEVAFRNVILHHFANKK